MFGKFAGLNSPPVTLAASCAVVLVLALISGCGDDLAIQPDPPVPEPFPSETERLAQHPAHSTSTGKLADALASRLPHAMGRDLSGLTQPATAGEQILDEDSPPDRENLISAEKGPPAPFPERVNPFEFAKGVDFDAPQAKQNEAMDVKLYGFIGTDSPKAIVSAGGRTKSLAVGEKWGVLEIVDITPPTVRIKANGVVRIWSLLGHHKDTM